MAERVEGTAVFAGGRWFGLKIEREGFARDNILEGKFQWFIYIVSYIHFITGETVSTLESQRYEFHAAKVRKTKYQSIVILAFKTDIPTILGRLGEGKEISTLLTAIQTPELWNAHDGVRGVYPRASKSLHNQRIKLHAWINREFQIHTEARLLSSELLSKCGFFWAQMADDVEAFYLHLVTTTYREVVS